MQTHTLRESIAKRAAQQFNLAARENGDESRSVSIEEHPIDMVSIIKDSDSIGIAFPVYAMNIPPIMKRLIARLNADLVALNENRPLYVLITAGYADGCGPYEVLRQFSSGTARPHPCGTRACTPTRPSSPNTPDPSPLHEKWFKKPTG